MRPKKPLPFRPGLVRGQLPHSPLRVATTVEVVYSPISPMRPILDYPSRAETPNEASRRQLSRGLQVKVMNKAVVKLDVPLGDWIL